MFMCTSTESLTVIYFLEEAVQVPRNATASEVAASKSLPDPTRDDDPVLYCVAP